MACMFKIQDPNSVHQNLTPFSPPVAPVSPTLRTLGAPGVMPVKGALKHIN